MYCLSNSFAQDFQLGKEYEFTETIANIPPENLLQMWNDPEFGKDMYALTGSIYHLPLEESLLGSELDQQYKQFIFEDLEKYKYNPENDVDEEDEEDEEKDTVVDKADEALKNLLNTDVVKKSRSKNPF